MQNNLRVTLKTPKSVKPVAVNFLEQDWKELILEREIYTYAQKKENVWPRGKVLRGRT